MQLARAYHGETVTTLDDVATIRSVLDRGEALVWIDLLDPADPEYDEIQELFELHPLAIEDARKHGQRPKLEIYRTHSFVVAYGAAGDPADLPEVDCFVGPNWIVTVRERNRHGVAVDTEAIRARFERTRGECVESGYLLYTLLDEVVDGYFGMVDRIEDHLEQVEAEIWVGSDGHEMTVQRELLRLRRELIVLRRRVVPLRDVVLAILRREVAWIEDHNLIWFQDVLDHLLRIIDQIDNLRELLGNAVDAHLATAANRMNLIMKKMTSWGAILIVASIITGAYGMNFVRIPGADADHGFAVAVSSILVVTVALYVYFKRKDWL